MSAALTKVFGNRPSRFAGGDTSRIGLGVVCVGLIAYVQLRTGNFVTEDNFDNILNSLTPALFVAAAAGPLLISGNVDLSLGGMLSVASVVAAEVGAHSHSAVLMVLAAVLVGVICGLANGLLVRLLQLSPIIVTIATGGIYTGLAFLVSNNSAIFGFPESVIEVGREYVGGVPLVAAIAAIVFVTSGLILNYTRAGLRTYAIGGDRQAARQAGINDDRHVLALYVLTGAAVGLAALALTARLGSGTPDVGTGFEIDILTALILGGIGFAGGTGRPAGIAVGLITIEVFNAAAVFLGFSDYIHQVARGGILLLALLGDQLAYRYRLRRRTRPSADPAAQEAKDGALAHAVLSGGARRSARHRGEEASEPTMVLRGVSKAYGGVAAVADIDLDLHPGQVTCLVGDNGAGKSTLVKLITGVVRPDQGAMTLGGANYSPATPGDARGAGIETVYQDLALCPNLGAAANLVLGSEPTLWPGMGPLSIVDRASVKSRALDRLRRMAVHLPDLNRPISALSGGQRQSVAISRAAHPGVRLAILDEPTAALGVGQRRTVLDLIGQLANEGVAVLVVSHDVENVMEIADRVVVMRLGRVSFDGGIEELDMERLVLLMAGIDRREPEYSSA